MGQFNMPTWKRSPSLDVYCAFNVRDMMAVRNMIGALSVEYSFSVYTNLHHGDGGMVEGVWRFPKPSKNVDLEWHEYLSTLVITLAGLEVIDTGAVDGYIEPGKFFISHDVVEAMSAG